MRQSEQRAKLGFGEGRIDEALAGEGAGARRRGGAGDARLGKNSVTFYQGLRLINASGFETLEAFAGGSAGFYGFLCFLSLLAVFLPHVWKDRRASFGLAAPLVLMLLAAIIAYSKMSSQRAGEAASQMRSAISIGFGGWLALIGSAHLAWQALRSLKAAA